MITFIITAFTLLFLGIAWKNENASNVLFKWGLYAVSFYLGSRIIMVGDEITSDGAYIFLSWLTLILAIIWSSKGKLNQVFKIILIAETVLLFLRLF